MTTLNIGIIYTMVRKVPQAFSPIVESLISHEESVYIKEREVPGKFHTILPKEKNTIMRRFTPLSVTQTGVPSNLKPLRSFNKFFNPTEFLMAAFDQSTTASVLNRMTMPFQPYELEAPQEEAETLRQQQVVDELSQREVDRQLQQQAREDQVRQEAFDRLVQEQARENQARLQEFERQLQQQAREDQARQEAFDRLLQHQRNS